MHIVGTCRCKLAAIPPVNRQAKIETITTVIILSPILLSFIFLNFTHIYCGVLDYILLSILYNPNPQMLLQEKGFHFGY